MSTQATHTTVVAIYCPLWHPYDHAAAWKGEGWCEWELLKSARPRFPGHYQPLRPSWGCFDESDPAWASREIALAAGHGVDVFLVDWYWYSGVRIMEEALERGFLRAPNRNDLRFALMWANHHWSDFFPAPFGREWNSWLPSRHSEHDLTRVIDYCIEHYFREPNYWTVEGGLYFSLFEPTRFVNELGGPGPARRVLQAINRRLDQAGLPPLHLNAMTHEPAAVPMLRDAGFASTTTYNITTAGKAAPDFTESYEHVMAEHANHWRALSAAALPHMPVVTLGWDTTPRCDKDLAWPFPPDPRTLVYGYPYGPVVVGNTPERFGELCRMARRHVETSPVGPRAVVINAWNEWTEGSYLLPEERTGTAYLEAVREAFA